MPNWNHIVRERLAVLRLSPARETEIVEEVALHLEAIYEDALAEGLSAAQAEARALHSYDWHLLECELSRVEQTSLSYWLPIEKHRGGIRMESFWQDLRFSARMLAKSPSFSLIAVITLALGIGANTAIFSVVNAVLLRPLQFKDAEQLVWIWGTVPRLNQANHSPVEFLAYQAQQQSFTELAAYRNMSFNVTANGTGSPQPEQVQGLIVSANYFSLLGVAPMRGRAMQPEDGAAGAARVAVLSYELWQSRYGGAADMMGRTLTINGESVTVLGVMPPNFNLNPSTRIWLNPKQGVPDFQMNFRDDVRTLREQHYLRVLGRLKPGVTLQQAQADLDAIAARLQQQYSDQAEHGTRLVALNELFVSDIRQSLWLLFGAVGLVLLIACANMMNLLLVRTAARARELAIRAAVGASRASLLRQLLLESVLLALIGGGAGWWLARGGIALIRAVSPDAITRLREVNLDISVFLFTLLIAMVTGVIAGLVPALAASKTDLTATLKEGGRGASESRHRLRHSLVVAEVALALVVLIGAGLLVGSFARLTAVQPGFDPDKLLTFWITLTSERYGTETANVRFIKDLTARLETLPGVQGVAIGPDFPIQGTDTNDSPEIEGRDATPEQRLLTGLHVVNPRYFEALGVRLLQGRAFTGRDDTNAPRVIIINEAFAARVWPNESPLGKRLRFGPPSEPWSEVVGVVANVKHDGLHLSDNPQCYLPHLQQPWPFLAIAVRSSLEPASLLAAVRQTVQQIDPNLPLIEPLSMEKRMANTLTSRRLTLSLFSLFAVVALVLAAIGLYGVMSYGVTQRTHELGIRLALGATGRDVLRLIVGQGMRLVAIGLVLGVLGALAVSRLLTKLLFGVSATDPLTFVLIAGLLTAVALLACWVPARRATKVDPLVALRCE